MRGIKSQEDFIMKFEEVLGDKFSIVKLNYIDKDDVEMSCKVCGKLHRKKFHNALMKISCKVCTAKQKAEERYKDKWMSKDKFIRLLPFVPTFEIIDESINLNRHILVRNSLGVCKVSPRRLTKGEGLPSFSNSVDRDSYKIALYKSIHGENISFPNYKYKDSNSPVNIVCNRCGREGTVIECNIVKIGSGCRVCDTTIGAPRMTNSEFMERVSKINSGIEILEPYKTYSDPLLCKNKYGLVKIYPSHILNGATGSLKSAVDKTSYMIEQFKGKHGDRYNYDDYIYKGNRSIGKFHCKEHGEFIQLTDVHLMGHGCPTCALYSPNKINGHSRSKFILQANGRECVLYLIKLHNHEEEFYKIGITSYDVITRIKKASDVKYNYDVIKEYKSFDAGHIWDLEKSAHRTYKSFSYKPRIYFKGETECFDKSLPIDSIKEFEGIVAPKEVLL